eukprot:1157433-Pelagomonas_calceolata.AAC.11
MDVQAAGHAQLPHNTKGDAEAGQHLLLYCYWDGVRNKNVWCVSGHRQQKNRRVLPTMEHKEGVHLCIAVEHSNAYEGAAP